VAQVVHERVGYSDGAVFVAIGCTFGVLAMLVNAVIDGFAIAFTQSILKRNVCLDGFSDATVVAMLAVAMVTSVLVGMWLYRVRLMVAANPDPGEEARSAMITRRFAQGSMGLFILATPLKWLFVLGMAYCNAGAGA
jgi:hypothetical protein